MEYRYLFGPVASRRLGMSLGIDLIPHKVCSLDCVYCECGETTKLTDKREEYVHIYKIINELKDFLNTEPKLDYITFSGSGEPLLNKAISGIIEFIKQNFPNYKIALLTNSTLFVDKTIRTEILSCDLIVPSLDAVSKNVFNKINRPLKTISPMDMINSLVELRKEFSGKMWLEIFIIPGYNDSEQELDLLSKAAERINADKVQLNFLDRPGVLDTLRAPSEDEVKRILSYFSRINIEVVSTVRCEPDSIIDNSTLEATIFSLIRRRPCTVADIVKITNKTSNEIEAFLDELLKANKLTIQTKERGVFYSLTK